VPKSSDINLLREIVSVSSSKLINTVGVILLISIMNTEFSVSEVGVFFFFFVLVGFLSNFVAGVGKAIRKRVSGNEGKRSEYLIVGIIIALIFQFIVSSILIILFIYIPDYWLPETVSNASIEILLGSIFLLFTQSLGKLMLNYNSGLGYPSRSEWFGKALPGVLFFVLTVGIVIFNYEIAAIFFVGSISYLLSSLIMFISTRPKLTIIPSKKDFESILSFSKWSILSRIASNIYNSADVLLLGIFVGSISVSYYESTDNLAHVIYVVPYGLFAVTSVKISGLDEEGRKSEILSVVRESIKLSSILPVMFLFLFMGFGDTIIEIIYNSEYSEAYYFLIGLAGCKVVTSYRKPIEGLNHGTDNPDIPFYSNTLAILVNFSTVLPLIWFFGGIGVVVSTFISQVIRLLSIVWMSREYIKEIDPSLSFVYSYIVGIILITFFVSVKLFVSTGTVHEIGLMLGFFCTYMLVMYSILDTESLRS
jgi:O-antigen/teichoic acid export membrane protein